MTKTIEHTHTVFNYLNVSIKVIVSIEKRVLSTSCFESSKHDLQCFRSASDPIGFTSVDGLADDNKCVAVGRFEFQCPLNIC